MTEHVDEQETSSGDGDHVGTADILIARIAADHRAGRDISKDLRALNEIGEQQGGALLDRLASTSVSDDPCLTFGSIARTLMGPSDGGSVTAALAMRP